MSIIKRDKAASTSDLVNAIDKLIPLLKDQHEDEAVGALHEAADGLRKATPGTPDHREAVNKVLDAFDEHELMAYTHQRQTTEWTEAEELSQASSRVLTLARRMK